MDWWNPNHDINRRSSKQEIHHRPTRNYLPSQDVEQFKPPSPAPQSSATSEQKRTFLYKAI